MMTRPVPPPAGQPHPPSRRAALLEALEAERYAQPIPHKGRRTPPEPDDPAEIRRRRIVLNDIPRNWRRR